MPDISITDGNTSKIINKQMAQMAADDTTDTQKYIIYTDSDIRINTDEGQARHGLPILTDTYIWDFDPHEHEIFAYADGADATVTVQRQEYTFSST